MNSFAALAALALVVPAAWASLSPQPAREVATEQAAPKFGSGLSDAEALRSVHESYQPEAQHQVRIHERVIIRITPSRPRMRQQLLTPPPGSDGPVRFREKKADRCVEIEDIAGITPMQPNRLVMFMRDHKMLSATLERACDPDAFYLGAFVEQNEDGKLCTGRDALRSRTGATCRIAGISRMVAIKD